MIFKYQSVASRMDLPRKHVLAIVLITLGVVGVPAYLSPGPTAHAMQSNTPQAGPYLTPKDVTLDPGQKLFGAPPVYMSMGMGVYSAANIITRPMRAGEVPETYTVYQVDADGKRTPAWHIIESR